MTLNRFPTDMIEDRESGEKLSDYLQNLQTTDANAELIAARKGETLLGNRLDKQDALLAETAKVINVKKFGVKGDGTTNDTNALIAARDYVLANGGIFYVPEDLNCYISGDLNLIGIKNLVIKGKITGTSTDMTLTIGFDSTKAEPTHYEVNNISNLKLRVQGVMNGEIHVSSCPYLQLYADGNNATGYALAYSRFHLGIITKLEITSVAGSRSAWINENKFFGGRVYTLIIGGAYPHNNNVFYAPMFESFTADISNGKYNRFYDCRFENTTNITFAAGTTHNFFYRSYYTTDDNYLRNDPQATITDNGKDNGVISALDSAHKKEIIYEMNAQSNNFRVDLFAKDDYALTVNASYADFFDTGIVPLNNPIGIFFSSDQTLFSVFLYAYDANKNLLTTAESGFTGMIGSFNTTNYYYYSGALAKEIGIPIYPTTNAKFFRIAIRTGSVASSKFNYLRLIKIEQIGKQTSIPSLMSKKFYESPSKPTTGTWKKGEYVKNTAPTITGTAGSQYVVKGWTRLTDGSTHVLNTDWVEDRALTGT